MAKTAFKFHVISDTESYLFKVLGIQTFRTLVVVNKKGKIVKYLDGPYHRLKQFKATFKREASE